MSDDEPVMHGKSQRWPALFTTIRPAWRSKELGDYLHSLDDLYREDWAQPIGKRATAGNPPRTRIDEDSEVKVRHGPVPVGLWRNCYDAGWLNEQRDHVIARLRIIDSDFDFTVPLM